MICFRFPYPIWPSLSFMKFLACQKFADELFRLKATTIKSLFLNQSTVLIILRFMPLDDAAIGLTAKIYRTNMQYRDEKPGQIGGLQRTRGFTVDDGHTFCRVDQIEQEASMLVEVIEDFYKSLGLWGQHWVSLSVRIRSTRQVYWRTSGLE